MAPKRNLAPASLKRPTRDQLRAQSETAILSAAWNSLDDAQRGAWGAAARSNRRSGAKAGQRRCTGRMLFFRVNSHRLALELPLLPEPPSSEEFTQAPLVKLVITNTAGRIALKLKVSGGDPEGVMVCSCQPVSPGTMSWKKFVRIGFLPRPVRGVCDITRLYVTKYGVPPVGSKVFVRVQQMKDYTGHITQTTSDIVRGRAERFNWQKPQQRI
jgi:hypothetical protein